MRKYRRAAQALAAAAGIVTVVGGAAASPIGTADASAATTGSYAYVWANQPTAASYTPSGSYSKNSSGVHNHITRNSTGNYIVTMPNMGTVGGGTVDVTGYDTSGYCKVGYWVPSGSALAVNVLCYAAGGAPADSYFDASFGAASTPPAHLTYLWANSPTASSYVPDTFYEFNSSGGTDSITRNGTGNYTVAIPGIGLNAGTVKVSGYGGDTTNCRVGSWGGSPTLDVNVLCTDASGNPADAEYSMTWVNKGSLLARSGGKWGYVWANGPTSSSYTPSTLYQANSSHALNTITRLGTGSYLVDFPNLGGGNGDVQVSAYSTDAVCNSSGWGGDGSGGADVYVSCYSPSGAAVDSFFDAQYGV